MKFLRRTVGKTRRDKWRNNRIIETLDQEPILNYIERISIKWYGHVLRMQDYRKPKQAMEARREKRRGRGRPMRTWEDCVIDVARRKGKTLADLRRLAQGIELLLGNGLRTQSCKAIGIDKEKEEEDKNVQIIAAYHC
jgi:hypothetical protein